MSSVLLGKLTSGDEDLREISSMTIEAIGHIEILKSN
jgi:hypothetical protein